MIDLSLDNRIFIRNELDEAIQELDILFNTENTELLGYPEFGTIFEQFSWQLNPNEDQVTAYINQKIQNTIYLSKFPHNIRVNILKGSYRLIYHIVIEIYDNNGNKAKREYQFR